MADEKEDFLQANARIPEVNGPDLKKRKRGGAAWSVTGDAPGGAIWAAAVEFFSAMSSTLLGKLALAAAAFAMIATVSILAFAVREGMGDGRVGTSIDLAASGARLMRALGGDR